jgi:uncharacterized membrane protein YccC
MKRPVPLLTQWCARLLDADDVRHGAQMAAAVVVAYMVSVSLGLPEGFWAVMSALIVMRARTGATLGQGWGRIKGTLLGTLGGLMGVWMQSIGLATTPAALGVVAALAFVTALLPTLRSAPITALIILAGGTAGDHSPWQLAGLRIGEIAIGIAAGLAVQLMTTPRHSAAHLDDSVKTLLDDLRNQTRRSLTAGGWSAHEREGAARAMRQRLGRLALLADSADIERGIAIGKIGAGEKIEHLYRRRAALISRIVQDTAMFGRIFEAVPARQGDPLWQQVADAVDAVLAQAAGSANAENGLAMLAACLHAEPTAPLPDAAHVELMRLLAAPVTLLSGDVQTFLRLCQPAIHRVS